MKKSEKEAIHRELEYLTQNDLTAEELKVIRALNGASRVPGNTVYSKRTVEAVLQGRRSNPQLVHSAIHNAKERLKEYITVMDRILNKLRND